VDVALLRSSFDAIRPHADDLAKAFYARMLGTFPQVRPLFAKTDFESQRKNLMATLGTVVALADKPEELSPVLERLGQSHNGHGVDASQYPYVEFSLLATLADHLGDGWTAELAETWEAALDVVSTAMIAAQEAATA
jgi:hemoglobin-like flavoprotein